MTRYQDDDTVLIQVILHVSRSTSDTYLTESMSGDAKQQTGCGWDVIRRQFPAVIRTSWRSLIPTCADSAPTSGAIALVKIELAQRATGDMCVPGG